MRMEELHKEDFFHCLQDEFRVIDNASGPCGIHLKEVNSQGSTPRQEIFSLLFQGPETHYITQGIHTLAHDRLGEITILLVPVGKDAEGFQYEAVFNRLVSP